jgi:hypothetical protein
MEPAAKEYIQKFRMTKNKKVSTSSSILDIKKEEALNKSTYKECLMKGVDPLDSEYIDCKLEEKFEAISSNGRKILKKKF